MKDLTQQFRYYLQLCLTKLRQWFRFVWEMLRPGKSLTNRICFGMLLLCICVFIANSAITMASFVGKTMEESAERGERDLDKVQMMCDAELEVTETAAYTLAAQKFNAHVTGDRLHPKISFTVPQGREYRPPKAEEIYDILESMLQANPKFAGVAIGFERGIRTGYSQGFVAAVERVGNGYSSNEADSTQLTRPKQRGNGDYFDDDWYKVTKELDAPRWAKPMVRADGSVLASFCIPIHRADSSLLGVLALHLSLDQLTRSLEGVKPFENSHICIVDEDDRLIACQNREWLNNELMLVDALHKEHRLGYMTVTYTDDKAEADTGQGVSNHVSMGPLSVLLSKQVEVDGHNYQAIVAPIAVARWKVVMLVSLWDYWGGIFELLTRTARISLFCILIILLGYLAMFILMRRAMLKTQNFEDEMSIAGKLQLQMIPKQFPAFPDRKEFDIYGFLRPAKQMGGDLYDYVMHHDKLFFCLGDVSGKGVTAALLMSEVHSLFRNVCKHTDQVEKIVEAINQEVAEGNESNMFCTLFVGAMDVKTHELTYCNAGHNPPVLISPEGKAAFLDVLPNLAVGLFEDFAYQPQTMKLETGTSLFIYTDGVSEAESVQAQLFTDQAIVDALQEKAEGTPQETIEHILGLVEHHARFADQSDDITMLCLKSC